MLCGKIRCPLIIKAQSMVTRSRALNSTKLEGSTPPGVFVGRIGHPKVYVGPMVPPYYGDTEILDTPELWLGKSINEIVDYRFSLIRGKSRISVFEAQSGSRLLDALHEVAMSSRPVDSEVEFAKRPTNVLTLSDESQPFGPSAPMRSFRVSPSSADRRIEKAYYDKNMKAVDAIWTLYRDRMKVTTIQRAFSLGMFGMGSRRKLVPTRWSITAVDSSLSLRLIDEVKMLSTIDEYQVYRFNHLDNIFVVILMPEKWRFEWIEAWFPGTAWNPTKERPEPVLMGDYEGYEGRSSYASIGGCYYSARLAVSEKLKEEKRQGSALILREIHQGYVMPVGVWNVRESVRATLRGEPQRFDTFGSALGCAMSWLTIPLKKWIQCSAMLKLALFQRKITDYSSDGSRA